MPIKKCSKDGKSGVKWGDSGKCYTGKGARRKAARQAAAAYASGYKKESHELQEEIDEFFERAKNTQEIDPTLQSKIDKAKEMSTWDLMMNPPWEYEEDFSPDLVDIDIDIENV